MKKVIGECDGNDHDHGSIGEQNANTAFTFSCKTNNEIYLYRKEEWFKVLCHELFHSLGLDFSEVESSHIDQQILSIFPVKADVRLYESYCEIWGELINVLFIAYLSVSTFTVATIIPKIETMIYEETMFSLFQASKILTYMGISYEQMYGRTVDAQKARQLRYKETTPILSYYIIKSIFILHINEFLEWCNTNNGGSLLDFGKSEDLQQNLNSYVAFVREHHADKDYVRIMGTLRTWFLQKGHSSRADDSPLLTMRMTLFEI
jgi:hypothetical protein